MERALREKLPQLGLDARLQQEYPDLPDDRRWNASLLLPRAAGSILRLAATLTDQQGRQLVGELKVMTQAYVAELIRQEREPRGRAVLSITRRRTKLECTPLTPGIRVIRFSRNW